MNVKHTKKLTKDFPWITPTDKYGIGVGDGWYDIIYTLCFQIDHAIKFEKRMYRII